MPDAFQDDDTRRWLESEVLPAYLQRSRWFAGKSRAIATTALIDFIDIGPDAGLALVEVQYASGEPEIYQVPLCQARGSSTAGEPIARRDDIVLLDALNSAEFRAALWARIVPAGGPAPESRVLSVEQSNSSLLYGDRVFMKIIRRVEGGVNPDAEILRFLTEERKFPHVPAFVGALEWPLACGTPALLAIATAAVPNRGDAWSYTLAELRDFYRRAACDPSDVLVAAGPFLDRIVQLGTRTGELHVALAGDTTNTDFTPEPLTGADLTTLCDSVLRLWDEVSTSVSGEYASRVRERAQAFATHQISAVKTRTHGDYHLGQVLETGGDFVIIDFEGEPARPLVERRRKQSPVRDVAGMLRSLHYAAHAARPDETDHAMRSAEAWTAVAERTFLNAWRAATAGAAFRPATDADLDFLLRAFLLEKALYEVRYELNNRPTWLHIPLRGLHRVLAGDAVPQAARDYGTSSAL